MLRVQRHLRVPRRLQVVELALGSDLAPRDEPTGFLSIYGLMRELGRIFGPLVVGWIADAVGLTWSAIVLAAAAAATAFLMAVWVGDTRDPSTLDA